MRSLMSCRIESSVRTTQPLKMTHASTNYPQRPRSPHRPLAEGVGSHTLGTVRSERRFEVGSRRRMTLSAMGAVAAVGVSVGASFTPAGATSLEDAVVMDGSGNSKTGKRYWGSGVPWKRAGDYAKPSTRAANAERPGCWFLSMATVKMDGDKIFVRDDCYDGRRAFAEVGWRKNGRVEVRRCYNPYGGRTVAVCNFDWSEKPRPKTLTAYAQSSSGSELMGSPVPFWG